jgi:FAD-dependent urate hydroxylase
MEILIAGAGVGGLALAKGLLAGGHQVRMLERSPGLRQGGAAVTIFSNGAAALAELGVPIDGIGGDIEELRFRTAEGRLTASIDLRLMRSRTGYGVTTVSRRQLIELLARDLPSHVVQFDRGVEGVVPGRSRVTVIDSQGDKHRADVVVGADGIASRVRQVVDPTPAADIGWATWQGLEPLPVEVADGTYGLFQVGEAGFCGLMPAGQGMVQWWFDTPWSRDEPVADPVAWLRDRFKAYADPVPRVLAAISEVGLYPHVLHRVLPVWGLDRTTLVGDAAHAFPPTLAQGANQTLEDAWLLTRALALPIEPPEALRRYEQRRTRRVRQVSRLAGTELTNRPPHPVVRRLAGLVPRAVTSRAYLTMLRRWSSILHNEQLT